MFSPSGSSSVAGEKYSMLAADGTGKTHRDRQNAWGTPLVLERQRLPRSLVGEDRNEDRNKTILAKRSL